MSAFEGVLPKFDSYMEDGEHIVEFCLGRIHPHRHMVSLHKLRLHGGFCANPVRMNGRMHQKEGVFFDEIAPSIFYIFKYHPLQLRQWLLECRCAACARSQ
jgi:hypothetical protein